MGKIEAGYIHSRISQRHYFLKTVAARAQRTDNFGAAGHTLFLRHRCSFVKIDDTEKYSITG
jgi:hypothetical protein